MFYSIVFYYSILLFSLALYPVDCILLYSMLVCSVLFFASRLYLLLFCSFLFYSIVLCSVLCCYNIALYFTTYIIYMYIYIQICAHALFN